MDLEQSDEDTVMLISSSKCAPPSGGCFEAFAGSLVKTSSLH